MANVQSAESDREQAMKLSEIQRYNYQCEYSTPEGDYGSSIDPDGDGEWVKFTDAQAKSLADERRIASLEAELTAERTRRLKAEEVVDTLLVPVVIDDDLPDLIREAKAYRTQYPRVGEEK